MRCTGGEVGATSSLAPKIGPLGLVSITILVQSVLFDPVLYISDSLNLFYSGVPPGAFNILVHTPFRPFRPVTPFLLKDNIGSLKLIYRCILYLFIEAKIFYPY